MTVTIIAFGLAVGDAIGGRWCSTIQLHYQFASFLQIGSLLVCVPEVSRRTRRMDLTRNLFRGGGDVIGLADGLHEVLEPKA
jgi:hypothetical protein